MFRTKITNVGALIQLEDGGLMCSLTLSETQEARRRFAGPRCFSTSRDAKRARLRRAA
jgi:hypothetical protein